MPFHFAIGRGNHMGIDTTKHWPQPYLAEPSSTGAVGPSHRRRTPGWLKWLSFDTPVPVRSCETRPLCVWNLGRTQRFGPSKVRNSGPPCGNCGKKTCPQCPKGPRVQCERSLKSPVVLCSPGHAACSLSTDVIEVTASAESALHY